MAAQDVVATFSGVLVLSFGATILFSGLFTSYFGAGKSRKIGLGLVLVGLLALFWWVAITWSIDLFAIGAQEAWSTEHMASGVAALVAGFLGTIVALGLFLVAIMRA